MAHRPRPCRFCRKWFRPDPRVGDRQHACSAPGCQTTRERTQQAAWRKRNPDYQRARRLQSRGPDADADPPVAPPPLDRLPWDLAQTQFGVQGAEFLGQFGRLLLSSVKMQMEAQPTDSS